MSDFSEKEIQAVWEKAKIVNSDSKNEWRKDFAGAWIKRELYGKQSLYAWEIDHKKPTTKGVGDELDNLQLMH